jgi:hypothetical protein
MGGRGRLAADDTQPDHVLETDMTNHQLPSSWARVVEAVKTPLGFFALVVLVGAMILEIVAAGATGIERHLLIGSVFLLLVLCIMCVWSLARRPPSATVPPQSAGQQDVRPAAQLIFAHADSDAFGHHFDELLDEADRIVFIGIGISILRQDRRRTRLRQRLEDGCAVEVYAANPFSPHVQTRLIEEDTGSPRPLVAGAGLRNWLRDLVDQRATLAHPENLTVSLFPYYPTFAALIVRVGTANHYFFYPYGYAQLGTLSPVLGFSSQEPAQAAAVSFLDRQYEWAKSHSTPASRVFELQDGTASADQLTAFAVYLIPQKGSPLYDFGSDVLGYSVRDTQVRRSEWSDDVGAAAEFGIHVTVADALYCTSSKDVSLICEEVAFVARQFRPFRVHVRPEKGFPNASSVALVCEDSSGSLEALHHEMVARVYRSAAASNYSLGLAHADRDTDDERARLMIKRYHAPYVLQRFKPHFSLATSVSKERMDQVFSGISRLYAQRQVPSHVEISTIAVMARDDSSGRWRILKEYSLEAQA